MLSWGETSSLKRFIVEALRSGFPQGNLKKPKLTFCGNLSKPLGSQTIGNIEAINCNKEPMV